ncbi:UTRA domain-containing protein [Anaerobutyricum hallii]|nr:UTRA domain-containing protein [Anaerobutyricum hallii]
MGYEVETRIVECQEERSSETVAKKLNLLPGESVFKIKRVRYIKGDPISLHISYINARYKEKANSRDVRERTALCAFERELWDSQKKVSETLESVVASNEEAELLAVEKGHPLLLLRDVLYDEISRPYEYTKVVFRGDRIKIRLQYEE